MIHDASIVEIWGKSGVLCGRAGTSANAGRQGSIAKALPASSFGLRQWLPQDWMGLDDPLRRFICMLFFEIDHLGDCAFAQTIYKSGFITPYVHTESAEAGLPSWI